MVGACSSTCGPTKPCPTAYACMSGRCFAHCDFKESFDGLNVCGKQESYQCLLGLSHQSSGEGLCGYSAVPPPTTELVSKN